MNFLCDIGYEFLPFIKRDLIFIIPIRFLMNQLKDNMELTEEILKDGIKIYG